ncbi:MAG: hypothetical protein J6L81_02320 [Clostridia bacterium]|nr:hypothetical protein [Clostridia bacterium]
MLTMLTMMPEKKHRFPISVIKKILPPKTDGYMRRIGYVPYIDVVCESKNGSPDWRMVFANNLDTAGRLLMPKGIECPPDSGLTRFRPTRFIRQLFSNLLTEILLNMDNSPAERSVVLYGREAELSMLLVRLVPLVGIIKIITSRPDAIKEQAQSLEDQTGMTIIISDNYDAGDSTILFAPSGGAGVIKCKNTSLVISPDRPSSSSPCWVRSVDIAIPQMLEDVYTPDYDLLETAGAFCEIAGMEILSRLSPDAVMGDESVISPQELARLCVSIN